jgi:hypothetical protein
MPNQQQMRFEFSELERRLVFNTDLCLSEVGQQLAMRSSNKEGKFVVLCSETDGEEFLEILAREFARCGFRSSEEVLRGLAARLEVSGFSVKAKTPLQEGGPQHGMHSDLLGN